MARSNSTDDCFHPFFFSHFIVNNPHSTFNNNVEISQQIPFYAQRHRIKPGLTGWAQLCYPYGASVEDAKEKLQYDLYYLKNHSLLLDLIILLQTVEVVLVGEGAR